MFERPASGESAVLVQLDFGEGDFAERLAEHMQLLAGGSALLSLRESFAQQVVSALSAINMLKRSYDAAWFSQLSAGKVSNLLGP